MGLLRNFNGLLFLAVVGLAMSTVCYPLAILWGENRTGMTLLATVPIFLQFYIAVRARTLALEYRDIFNKSKDWILMNALALCSFGLFMTADVMIWLRRPLTSTITSLMWSSFGVSLGFFFVVFVFYARYKNAVRSSQYAALEQEEDDEVESSEKVAPATNTPSLTATQAVYVPVMYTNQPVYTTTNVQPVYIATNPGAPQILYTNGGVQVPVYYYTNPQQ